jgi:hypothetical protein
MNAISGSRLATAGRRGSGFLVEGIAVGLAGAGVVALWFLVVDVIAGMPFRTPALLGAALFDGARDPAAVVVTPRLVLGYTVVHAALYVALGVAAAGLFAIAERQPPVLFAMFMLMCCLIVVLLAAVAFLAQWFLDVLAPWTVLIGALLGAGVMAGLLIYAHRGVLAYAPRAGE